MCGYCQMQVLNASAVVVTSPLVFRYILFLSPNLFADFICVFFLLPYLFWFSCFPSGPFLCLCLFVLVSLKESRGPSLWCVLDSSALSSGCRAPAQCPLQITCKAGTPCTYTQMFCSHFPHEDSRQYARKVSISDGEMTPKRHLYSLCQSRRDRFSS